MLRTPTSFIRCALAVAVFVIGTFFTSIRNVAYFDTRAQFQVSPLALTQQTTAQEMKHILFYTTYWAQTDFQFGIGQSPFQDFNCPVQNCYATNNRTYLSSMSDFDGVMFHAVDFTPNSKDFQDWRHSRQRFVMMMMESPSTYNLPYDLFSGFFNWTMTYRLDSDIPRPYGWFSAKEEENDREHFYQPTSSDAGSWPITYDEDHFFRNVMNSSNFSAHRDLARRPKKVAWIVSHCSTNSKREDYVAELRKHIEVDVFGSCGNESIPCDVGYGAVMDNCSVAVETNYKFYLSFENSLCDDYVTEKFFKRVNNHVLPIVLGPTNYSKLAPPHSYVSVMDFDSPETLAGYLNELDKNESLYLSYFWWKEHYDVHQAIRSDFARSMCKLCAKLNDPTEPPKVYEDLEQWWSKDAHCRSSISIQLSSVQHDLASNVSAPLMKG